MSPESQSHRLWFNEYTLTCSCLTGRLVVENDAHVYGATAGAINVINMNVNILNSEAIT